MSNVIHFTSPDYPNYTSCGLGWVHNQTNQIDKVNCGNCVWTNEYKKANKERRISSTLSQTEWQKAVPDAGWYFVSDGMEVEIAWSSGETWYNSPAEYQEFDYIVIEKFKPIELPKL